MDYFFGDLFGIKMYKCEQCKRTVNTVYIHKGKWICVKCSKKNNGKKI